MIDMELVITRVSGLQRQDLERWIVQQLVLPDVTAAGYAFREIDVARVRLIQELRDDMQVNEEALPIVLSLLDQLYDLRRRLRELGEAIGQTAPEAVRQTLAAHLAKRSG